MNHTDPHRESEPLRTEIIESQKTQAEFIKWKLIAVGAIASISLGFTGSTAASANRNGLQLLLCAIPLVCAYVDFVSLHIMIRIVTIGAFLRQSGSAYEGFVFRTRQSGANPFIFETAALHGASFVFNAVLIGLSFADVAAEWISKAYLLAGILGLVFTAFAWVLYTIKFHRVIDLSQQGDQPEERNPVGKVLDHRKPE
jgi:hypothetical protein